MSLDGFPTIEDYINSLWNGLEIEEKITDALNDDTSPINLREEILLQIELLLWWEYDTEDHDIKYDMLRMTKNLMIDIMLSTPEWDWEKYLKYFEKYEPDNPYLLFWKSLIALEKWEIPEFSDELLRSHVFDDGWELLGIIRLLSRKISQWVQWKLPLGESSKK